MEDIARKALGRDETTSPIFDSKADEDIEDFSPEKVSKSQTGLSVNHEAYFNDEKQENELDFEKEEEKCYTEQDVQEQSFLLLAMKIEQKK